MPVKKAKKIDPKLIALSKAQRHEIDKLVSKYKIPRQLLIYIVWACARSRYLTYEVLRQRGYVLPGKLPARLRKKFDEVNAEIIADIDTDHGEVH